jgi:Uma2 family endonuclease
VVYAILSAAMNVGLDEMIPVPRTVRFPVEVEPPSGFIPDDPASWPDLEGRLEYVAGRLLLLPPCGDHQPDVSISVAGILDRWLDEHAEFTVGGNEAGMILDGEVRGADAAVWRRSDLGPYTGKYRRVAPVLAVEVAGYREGEDQLREKANWYLAHGVHVVWIVLPDSREVIVLENERSQRCGVGNALPDHPDLPGLHPVVDRFFRQL